MTLKGKQGCVFSLIKQWIILLLSTLMMFGPACQKSPRDMAMADAKNYRKVGRFDNALDNYRKALALDTSSVEARLGMGFCQIQLEQFSDAGKTYEALIKDHPELEQPYFRLGQLYLNQEQYPAAIKHLKAALKINPDFSDSHYLLGLAYGGAKDYGKAIQEFRATVEIEPEHVDAWYNMGNLFTRRKEYDEAIKAYKKVTALKSDHLMGWYMLGDASYALGRYEDAVTYFNRALEVNYGYTAAQLALKRSMAKVEESRR